MITIAYFTSRREPHWEWFFDSLANQIPIDDRVNYEVIVIDAHLWAPMLPETIERLRRGQRVLPMEHLDWERKSALAEVNGGRFELTHLPPKPNVWQGPFRLTQEDWFAASNARNTALIAARGDYFVGVDDLTVLSAGWVDQIRHAADRGYCVCGSYKKVRDLVVSHGKILARTEFSEGIDSRWNLGTDLGIIKASGSWMYGCSFGVPMALALEIEGFDEICDGQSAEDYDFGMRAERAGGTFYYNRNMLTLESEEGHHQGPRLKRKSKEVSRDRLPFNYTGNPMSDHVLLYRLQTEDRIKPLGPRTLLQDVYGWKFHKDFTIHDEPTIDWRDGTPLSELV